MIAIDQTQQIERGEKMHGKIHRYAIGILALALLLSVGSVFATWKYIDRQGMTMTETIPLQLNAFRYDVQSMPDEQLVLMYRLGDLLNNDYTNECVLHLCHDWW